ncbi:nitrate reductase cytochrome c-type subunit [Sulfurospirillum sp. 1307]|jgi:cytochrome c-type protein NapB
MFSKKTLIAAAALTAVIATGCAVSNTVSEESLGLRKTDLYSEDKVVPDATSYNKAAPGEAQVYERAFENAPPMIPHDVEGMLPITKDNNACLGCHTPAVAPSVGATPVPKSHLFDMRSQTVLATVSNARFNCSQCHAPQSNIKPLVKNEFQPEFRSKDGMKRSNLLDNLNEGVE